MSDASQINGSKDDSLSINEAFNRLDALLKDMEDPAISLEDSFARYKEGLELVKYCNASIEKIEQQITVLEEE